MPGMSNPQALNRYSYVLGNPLKYTDPSGHSSICMDGGDVCYDQEKRQWRGDINWGLWGPNYKIKDDPKPIEPAQIVADVIDGCNGIQACINGAMVWYYDELSYPLDQLIGNPPRRNPLGANELYFMEPAILMEMQNSVSTRFLQQMNVDPGYPYNYEPVYLDALQVEYADVYQDAISTSNLFSEAGTDTTEYLLDPKGGQTWVTKVVPEWIKVLRNKGYLPAGEK